MNNVEITQFSIKPKQSLGQNFLIDENIARKIIKEVNIGPNDIIIEIGPGHGVLTKHLIGKCKHTIAFEIDERIVTELLEKYKSSDILIIHSDFLKVSISYWAHKFQSKVRIVGNIPYHLTSSILFKIFNERENVIDLTIMVQKEVAKRIIAKPGTKDYGILSIFSQYYCNPEYLFDVTPNCFFPKPKVTSTVVRLRFSHEIDRVNESIFKNVVKTAFGKRRKILRNSLKYLPYDANLIQNIFDRVDFNFDVRPEKLSINEFVSLTKQIEKVIA